MNPSLTTTMLAEQPDLATAELALPDGRSVRWRLLRPEDGDLLSAYFAALGPETRRRYGPHPFDRGEAFALCEEIDPGFVLRFVAEIDPPELIAYFIAWPGVHKPEIARYAGHGLPLDPASDGTLAPSVADAYQSQGVGSLLLPHVLDVMRRLGKQRMVLSGGVQATNARAVRFYEKHGFQPVAHFAADGRDNIDMILAL